jgi:hypothetical protein
MLEGYKTWIGIIITIIGFTGLVKFATPEQWQAFAKALTDLIGVAITVYGNWDAHRRLDDLASSD